MTGRAILGLSAIGAVLISAVVMGNAVVQRRTVPNRVTVVYWEKWTGAEAAAMQKVVDAFNASQNRIYVRYLSISGVDTKTLLAAAGGDPPDVAGIWMDNICQFADANALSDLSGYAKASGLSASYYIPAYWNSLVYHHKLWALPSTPATIALHVRTDLVPADVATPATFPKTLEALDRLSDQITKRDKHGKLEMAGFLPSDPGWWNWAWSGLFGGRLVVGDKITVNSPEALRAFTWLASYTKRYGSKAVQDFQSGFGTFASPQDPFMDGKVATELNGVWKANYIHVYKPGLKWFAVPFPYPQDRPDLAGHSILSQDVLTIPRGAKHPEEAFEFIRFVQRQNVMEGLCAAHGKNSPLEKVSQHFFNTHQNPFIRMFDSLARSPKAIAPPQIGIFPQIRSEMDVAFQEVNTGQESPKQALDDAEQRLNQEWSTYKVQVLGEKP